MRRSVGGTVVLSLAVLANACASTTMIETEPKGAKVYADGMLLGTSPISYSDTKIIGSTTAIQLKKKGCETKNITLTRSEKFEVGPCIGGVFVLVPFLWVMGYNPNRNYELECKSDKAKKDVEEEEDDDEA